MRHQFNYRNQQLWCEKSSVAEIVKKTGTPAYLYSYFSIVDHFRQVQKAFKPVNALICFAVKSNSNIAVCRALVKAGSGCDVVSGGELIRALKAGANPKKIVYASVGKTDREIEQAVRAGILLFNVESEQELGRIDRICARLKKKQKVNLRMNPEVDPHTHHFITTGHKASKFGIDMPTVEKLLANTKRYPHLIFAGIHIHIGSQILEARPFKAAIGKALAVIARGRKNGAPIEYLNIGGGLGIIYKKEKPQKPSDYAKKVLPLLKKSGLKIILEPGRFIVGNSGILVTRVVYIKNSHGKKFAIVDAGMNDLVRPSLYGAYHEIQPVLTKPGSKKGRYDIVGPVCESGDFFAKDRTLPQLEAGDLISIFSAGAYGFVMASNYNTRPKPVEILVHGKRWDIIRKRETIDDLLRGEKIPAWLK